MKSCPRIFIVLISLVAAGCATTSQRNQMGGFETHWRSGDYTSAAAMFVGPAEDEKSLEKLNLLELLHYAEAKRLVGDFPASIAAYDRTEEHFKRFDEENFAENAAQTVGAILVNESITAYEGQLYEAVLSNSYKAMSFLSMGKPELARVELNRADDRTRRAVEYFSKLIKEERKVLEENEEERAKTVVQTLESDELGNVLAEKYGTPNQWAVYPSFINPFATYLHAMFFLASEISGDRQRAIDSFKRVAGMTDNPYVSDDLEFAENILASGAQNGRLWLIYENGIGPVLGETRIDVPIFLLSQSSVVPYTGIALPNMDRGTPAANAMMLSFEDENGQIQKRATYPLADMEKIARTEFKEKFDGILTRAIASAAVKAIIQAAATEEFGLVGKIAGGIFSAATTHADLRSWRAIPSRWDALSVNRPLNGTVRLEAASGALIREIRLPDWKNILLYVKQPTPTARPTIFVVDLEGKGAGLNEEYVAR